jgi:DNA-binding MarR family transcriptional regulator
MGAKVTGKAVIRKAVTRKADVPEPVDDAWEISIRLRPLIGWFSRTLSEKAGPHQLSLSHNCVLIRLEHDGSSTVSELARLQSMRPQPMSAIVADLCAAGLVRGVPDPSDGRRTILSLTNVGREELRSSRAERQDWLVQRVEAKLSPAERKRLIALIELLERLT